MIPLDALNATVLEYQQGDPTALQTLYATLQPLIRATIRRLTLYGPPSYLTREDLAQQCWLVLADLAARWEPQGSFVAYAYRSFPSRLRRWAMHDSGRIFTWSYDDVVAHIDAQGDDEDLVKPIIVSELLAELPESDRCAVVLSVLEGETYDAIGDQLGVSRATAHRLCARGLARPRATVAG